jgi:AcrR family transcriptional regulator
MYRIKKDQRSKRSSRMLYEALAGLMGEKPFHQITVTDLSDAAKVGRTTFYRNFDEIEDILRMKSDQTFDTFVPYLMEFAQKNRITTPVALIKPMLRFFYLHSDIVELLMLAKRTDILQDSIRARLEPFRTSIASQLGASNELVDYAIAIRTGLMLNILVEWIATGKQQAPDDLADALGEMSMKMVALDQFM